MAIEQMRSVWLLAPRVRARAMLERVAGMGMSHVVDCEAPGPEERKALGIERLPADAGDLERRVQMLREAHEVLCGFGKTVRDRLQGFIATPVEVTCDDVRRALREVEIESLYDAIKTMERRHSALSGALEKAIERRRALNAFAALRMVLPGSKRQHWTAAWLGTMPLAHLERLRQSGRLPEASVVAEAARMGRRAIVQVVGCAADRERLGALLREFGLEPIDMPEESLTMEAYLARQDEDIASIRRDLDASTQELRQASAAHRDRIEIVLGYWEERLRIAAAASLMARSKRLSILKGFVRMRDLEGFRKRLADELPEAVLLDRDPLPTEAVPVSLKNPKLFAPAQFLLNMFGLPNYFTFDPSPVIFFSFLLFFGICFGDVFYGLGMFAMGLALARRYRRYPNLRHFFLLLGYAGVPTMIVGALTGAWAADLWRFFDPQGVFGRLSRGLALVDPVERALPALLFALTIGMLNQFTAIIMLMVRHVRQGNPRAALFDGGFWLILLPGFVLLAATLFIAIPPTLRWVGWGLFGAGALGLVLTQGRAEKGLAGKAMVGVVSLYGIVGTYGITAFIGDTLSYSRLLALGLTTGIVGMAFNMIAEMTRGIPYVGLPVFLALLVLGHVLNFSLSMLGGFVHSVRLTFVEFFGRFYQGGAPRFTPIGVWQGRIRVPDRDTVWTDD